MADEGKSNEGTDWNEANAEAQLAGNDRAAFSEAAYTYSPEADRKANDGWARAYAKDERGTRPQRQSQPHTRSPQSRRATWRAKQSWNRTVARTVQQTHHWTTPASQWRDASWQPSAKGGLEDTKLWAWFKRLMNLNW